MYPVSERYKTAIRARARTDRVVGTLTLTDGTVLALGVQDFMSGSLTLDNQCVTGEELAFGCVYLGQAAFSLRTSLSRYAFYGAKLVLRYELQLPGGSWEAVPLGVYTVAEAERKALYVSIKAYDNILPLQSRWDGTAIQGNAYEMLAQIADGCGLELGQTAGGNRCAEPQRCPGLPVERRRRPDDLAGLRGGHRPAVRRLWHGGPRRAARYPAVCQDKLRFAGGPMPAARRACRTSAATMRR